MMAVVAAAKRGRSKKVHRWAISSPTNYWGKWLLVLSPQEAQ